MFKRCFGGLHMPWMTELTEQLKKGAFLMVDGNPMIIGWAQYGILWGKPTLTVYVRHSRYTFQLLQHASTFTVSVPKAGTMSDALAFCGSRSGRDVDKMNALHAALTPPRFGAQCGFSGCRYHIECSVLFRADLDENLLDNPSLKSRYYQTEDTHCMFVGEILGITEEP